MNMRILGASESRNDFLFLVVASSLALAVAQSLSPQPRMNEASSSPSPPSPSSPTSPSSPAAVLAVPGGSVNFSWPIPPGPRNGTLLMVTFNSPSTIVFLTPVFTHPFQSAPVVMTDYAPRVQVADSLAEGMIQFTLTNVTFDDGGRYICTRGLTEADVLEDCGSTLVVLDAPVNPRITLKRTPLTGNGVTLHCTATSMSTPRDHRQPMKFRWFEAKSIEGDENSQAWTEIDEMENSRSSEQNMPNVDDQGDIVKGDHHSGSFNEGLRLTSLARKDEGRKFACAASEGLELWSAKSVPFVLRPEWKPLPSDLTLTPAGSSMTLTSGESQEVTCHARCRPHCHLVWKKVKWDNHSITLVKDGTLNLQRVGPQHQGVYQCRASNRHGSTFLSLTLSVLDSPQPWYRDERYVIIVISIATVGVALGMTGVAVVVYKCRQRTTPFVWPHRRANHDAVPLSALDNRYTETPSLSSYI